MTAEGMVRTYDGEREIWYQCDGEFPLGRSSIKETESVVWFPVCVYEDYEVVNVLRDGTSNAGDDVRQVKTQFRCGRSKGGIIKMPGRVREWVLGRVCTERRNEEPQNSNVN